MKEKHMQDIVLPEFGFCGSRMVLDNLEQEAVVKNQAWYNTRELMRMYQAMHRYRDYAVWENTGSHGERYSRGVYEKMMKDRKSSGTVVVRDISDMAETTRICLAHMDRMLDCYKEECLNSLDPIQQVYWRILDLCYLRPVTLPLPAIAPQVKTSTETASYWHDQAISQLAVYFFGVRGLPLSFDEETDGDQREDAADPGSEQDGQAEAGNPKKSAGGSKPKLRS